MAVARLVGLAKLPPDKRAPSGFLYRCDAAQIVRVRDAAERDGMTPEEMIKHIVDEWVAGRLAEPGDVKGEGDQ